jgi:hypothetical protein
MMMITRTMPMIAYLLALGFGLVPSGDAVLEVGFGLESSKAFPLMRLSLAVLNSFIKILDVNRRLTK